MDDVGIFIDIKLAKLFSPVFTVSKGDALILTHNYM